MPDGYFVQPQDVEEIEMFEGLHRRTLATTDEAMLCQFRIQAGCVVAPHHHMNDQIGYVLSGKMKITIGKQTCIVTAGNSYAIPGGITHSALALEDSLVLDVFSPPREDYRTEAR